MQAAALRLEWRAARLAVLSVATGKEIKVLKRVGTYPHIVIALL
jgi:hypothetical protein